MNVNMSCAPDTAVGVYADPLTWSNTELNVTEPVVAAWVILKFAVWPAWILAAVIWVLAPPINLKSKKNQVIKQINESLNMFNRFTKYWLWI